MLHHRVKNLQSVEDLVHPAAPLHHSLRCHRPSSAHTTHGAGGEGGRGRGEGGGCSRPPSPGQQATRGSAPSWPVAAQRCCTETPGRSLVPLSPGCSVTQQDFRSRRLQLTH